VRVSLANGEQIIVEMQGYWDAAPASAEGLALWFDRAIDALDLPSVFAAG
jgi:hypothetical protein